MRTRLGASVRIERTSVPLTGAVPSAELEVEHLFLDLDTKQSGAITLDEFRNSVLGRFGELGAATDAQGEAIEA